MQITTASIYETRYARKTNTRHGPPRRIPQKNGQKMVRRSHPGIFPERIKICARPPSAAHPPPPFSPPIPLISTLYPVYFNVAYIYFHRRNFEFRLPRAHERADSRRIDRALNVFLILTDGALKARRIIFARSELFSRAYAESLVKRSNQRKEGREHEARRQEMCER